MHEETKSKREKVRRYIRILIDEIAPRIPLYIVAFSPLLLGSLLFMFGDASSLHVQIIAGLSVLVTASLVFYNKQADDQNKKRANPFDPKGFGTAFDGQKRTIVPPDPKKPNLFTTQIRFVDHALIVSLWVFGAIGVRFSGSALHLEIYFQTITALAVMYVLLVAFRIDRLVRRTAEEEELALDLMETALNWRTIYQRDIEDVVDPWWKLNEKTEVEKIVIKKWNETDSDGRARDLKEMGEELAKDNKELFRNIMKGENKDNEDKIKKCAADLLAGRIMIEVMEKINKDKSVKELTTAYHLSIVSINIIEAWEWEKKKANPQGRTSDIDERIVKLKEFQIDFTKFMNSKQQGNNPSELTAIGLIGFSLVALMHLGFPEGITGVGAFSVHLFTLFISTIVVFLFFNILDLENDRNRSLYDIGSNYSELWKGITHCIYMSPSKKWIFTVSVVTAIVYVVLLWDKLVSSVSFLH